MKQSILIVALIISTFSGYLVLNRQVSSTQTVAPVEMMLPSPSPFPFQDMTIPFLRSREYQSSLSELQKVSESSTYTSYLTSYHSDNLKINALLTQPKGEPPATGWPAVIFVHGYIPPTLYRTQEKYTAYVDYLAKNGFVVFKIDLRGHGNSQGEPGGAYYSSDYIIDTLNAYAALEQTPFIDKTKIGLWGHSMAGNVLLRSLAAKPTIPAAVIWAGAVYTYEDMRAFGIDDNSYRPPSNDTNRQRRRQELFNAHGQFSRDSEFWKQVVATNYLHDIKGAIQLHHAVDDSVVNVGYSRGLNQLLDQTSIPHQLYEYSSGGHNITDASFSKAMERTVDFFKTHL